MNDQEWNKGMLEARANVAKMLNEAVPKAVKMANEEQKEVVGRFDSKKKHDEAGLEGWLQLWVPEGVDVSTLDGDSRSLKERLRDIFAQQIAQARVEEGRVAAEYEIHKALSFVGGLLNSRETVQVERYLEARLASLKEEKPQPKVEKKSRCKHEYGLPSHPKDATHGGIHCTKCGRAIRAGRQTGLSDPF